jgi:outer membrane protein TolC
VSRRPEAIEARELVRDSRIAVRIARSLELPSLDGVLSYEAAGAGQSAGDALPVRQSAFLFGFRSRYGLNHTALYSQRREAEITLASRERNYQLLEDDLARDVRRAYRRLEAERHNEAIASENLKVAELQAKVARLRFEKGLSDNFNVVDTDNLWTRRGSSSSTLGSTSCSAARLPVSSGTLRSASSEATVSAVFVAR